MRFQPGCEQFCGALRPEIYRTMLFEVTEDRSLGLAFAEGTSINAEDRWNWMRRKISVLH